MPIADGDDLNYPMLYYLIKLSLFAGFFLYFCSGYSNPSSLKIPELLPTSRRLAPVLCPSHAK
jgi:hypothetical protein